MKIIINDQIIKKTTDCDKNFKCLKGKKYLTCKITGSIRGEYHILDKENCSFCNYKIFFNKSSMCNCPTRKAIYELYKF